MALCTLIKGQTALLSFRKETLKARIMDEEDRTTATEQDDEDDGVSITKDKWKANLKGTPAIVFASIIGTMGGVVAIVWAVHRLGL